LRKISQIGKTTLTRVPRVQEIESSNSGPDRSYTALQMVRHHFNMYTSNFFALAL